MKILICNVNYPAGATYYWHHDLINVLENMGHNVKKYNNVINDWHKFNPDLYIGMSAFIENIPFKNDRANCKILIGVNFNDNNRTQDLYNKYGFMRNSYNIYDNQNEWINKIEPDVIYTWTHKNLTNDYYNLWLSKYPNCINTIHAGNPFLYKKSSNNSNNTYDFGYVGGRWGYKAQQIDKLFLPILKNYNNFKIYGNRGWGGIKNCGGLLGINGSKKEEIEFLQQCKIVPCFSEPHTITHGVDLPDRIYKASMCGALVLHDNVYKLTETFPDIIIFNTSEELDKLIKYYLTNEEERIQLAEKQRKYILNNHTYLCRFKHAFELLNWNDEVNNVNKYINNII